MKNLVLDVIEMITRKLLDVLARNDRAQYEVYSGTPGEFILCFSEKEAIECTLLTLEKNPEIECPGYRACLYD